MLGPNLGTNVLRALKIAVKEADEADANMGKFWIHGPEAHFRDTVSSGRKEHPADRRVNGNKERKGVEKVHPFFG